MQFFVVDKKPKDGAGERYRTDFSFDDAVQTGAAPSCQVCDAFVGMLEVLPPVRVHLETWGAECGDFAFWTDSFLVSAQFREQYEGSGLRGLTAFEKAEVVSHRRFANATERPPDYFLARPKRGGARIDVTASEVEWTDGRGPRCACCLSGDGAIKRWRRVIVDEGSWEGDDVFYAYGLPGQLLVSARFADWSASQGWKNFCVTPAAESSHDFCPWKKSPTSSHSSNALDLT